MTGVRIHLTSGAQRVIEKADGARLDGPFFIITKWYGDLGRQETVLTLRAEDVEFAEVVRDGVRIDCVLGAGRKSP